MFEPYDRTVLRDLAKLVAQIAELPIMAERRRLWVRHNRLDPARPMVLVFPEGSWRELLPQQSLVCRDEQARAIEWSLRSRIYHHQHLHDDTVIEKTWVVRKAISHSGWGVETRHRPSDDPLGAWAFDPVINVPGDLGKLRMPEVVCDAERSARAYEEAVDLFGGILQVVHKGIDRVGYGLMNLYTGWRGLEQVMWDMYDEPSMLHDVMAFLEEGHRGLLRQYVDLNLLSLNNDATYHSSGGVGYSDELPRPGFDPARVRPCDLWASSESQEMAQVSPEQHATFILPYEKRLLAPFGLNGYGCCEDLTHKLDDVLMIPNLRRVSISPFADVARCAEKLGRRAIFSWKPHPAHLVGAFDEQAVRAYLRRALDATRGCVVEMILKDTHTCEGRPERFARWTDIARELVLV
ncbi:MAG: uroporphyrinogen decarboxylase/cobalamine-independent methonine synthase family protein [Anaerolineae bacterium]